MGKKSKTGQQRKDKFYHLAKETGYRSRAAFKLIQLNRKYEFLQKSRVLIDLCAAPGGWMQVSKQNMPVSSIVIGVDMYPFKPLPGCITIVEDITTDDCRIAIQKELKTWKADVVLHDGAPNVGKNWLHDAYTQSCLTLSALKMATTFLREGGWFITKIFRSKDYNSLLWVFKQLFKKVHATKPQASRNESAEIFVVCHYYLAPKKVDPKFLNSDYVFKEIEATPAVSLRLGKEKKPKAEGYPDDTTILHTKLNASTFMQCENPAISLQNAYEIIIDDEEILNHPATTAEIKKCCEDIKVLGRKELRDLVAWWKVFQQKKPVENETSNVSNETAENEVDSLSEEEKELDEIGKQVEELEDAERRAQKRKRKKSNKEKAKLARKINLNMKHTDDAGPVEETDNELFQLSHISTKAMLNKVVNQKPNVVVSEESKAVKYPKKIQYDPEKSYLDSSGNYYKTSESEEETDNEDETDSEKESLGLGLSDDDDEKDSKIDNEGDRTSKSKKRVRFVDSIVDNEPVVESHPLLTDLDYREPKDKRLSKAELWFDKDVFKDVEKEEDEDYELDKMTSVIKNLGGKIIEKGNVGKVNKLNGKTTYDNEEYADDENDDGSSRDDKNTDDEDREDQLKNETGTSTQVGKNVKKKSDNRLDVVGEPINEWDINGENVIIGKKKKKKERKTLDSVGLALGSMMVDSRKVKRDIIDSAWNRYAFNDENLPDWFVQDEEKHMRKEAPVPKDLVEEYEKRKEEINVRPIKKVAEAKARKKKRAARRLEKAKKKLENVMENPDATANEKARQIRKIYKKVKEPKPEVKYVVAKKHTAAKRMRRPRGLKGPYKVVDSRMKKDLKAKINKLTKNKSKTASRKIKKTFKPNRRK